MRRRFVDEGRAETTMRLDASRSWALPVAVACLVAACRDRAPEPAYTPADSAPRDTTRQQLELRFSDGATLLHLAARDGIRAEAESLLQAGYGVNAVDNRGYTPLHYAARAGHASVVEVLLLRGADVNAESPPEGVVTPLLLAAAGGHLAVVRLLLARGASTTITDDSGRTPLTLARRGGRSAIAALLEPLSPAWARLTSVDTLAFPIENEPDPDVWLADAVTPLAYAGGDWWVATATSYSGADAETSPCKYRRPWDGGTSDGGIWIERWRMVRIRSSLYDSTARLQRTSVGLQTLTASECTPQSVIDATYAATVAGLRGTLEANAVWSLSRSDTFSLAGAPPTRLRYRIERDSTIELYVESDAHRSERTLLCFAADGSANERCAMIDTPRTPQYENRVTPVSAAVVRDTVSVFGLRTYGERLEPAWISQPIGVVPVFLGRLPLRGAGPR